MTDPEDFEVRTREGLILRGLRAGSGPVGLLVLHGGPGGYGSDYLRPMLQLAGPGRAVAVFDQLGTGRSEVPPSDYPWSMESAVADVLDVRAAMGWRRSAVLGHSYGGMLALAFALAHPDQLDALILASTVVSTDQMEAEFAQQVDQVATADDVAHAYRADENLEHADETFVHVALEWLARFATAGDRTEAQHLLGEALDLGPAGAGLWGRRLWTATGALVGWTAQPRLGEIAVPTLVVHGGADMSTVEANSVFAEDIPDSRWITFQGRGHTIVDEPGAEVYLGAIDGFLRTHITTEGSIQ